MAAGRDATPLVTACIVLAGGTAKRLGGVSKPDYLVAGRRLLDILLDRINAVGGVEEIVVVAPDTVMLPRGVQRVLENPPYGGPLAGLGAGVGALSALPDSSSVALCTCDAPLSPLLWPDLISAATQQCPHAEVSAQTLKTDGELPGVDGVVPVTVDETNAQHHREYLLGIYRLHMLRGLSCTRHAPVAREFCSHRLIYVPDAYGYSFDVDTDTDAAKLARRMLRAF